MLRKKKTAKNDAQSPILNKWHEVYRLIAELLHKAYKGYDENPAQKMYERLKGTKFSELNKGRLFRDSLSRISEWGLDPIQIFATFNYPKIGEKRVEIINSLLEEFTSDKRVSNKTSFEGCTSPIITQIIQYRGWKPQNEIWEMFDEIMNKGISGLNNKQFMSLKKWRGIDIASLTMFLFWINSDEFLPMDRNTVDFLISFDILNQRPRTYNEYFDLCTKKLALPSGPYTSKDAFRNIVKDAYKYADKKYKGKVLSGSTASIISKKGKEQISEGELEVIAKRSQQERIRGFQIVALRPMARISKGKNSRQKHLKNLEEGTLYQFYHAYSFNKKSDDIIVYDPDKEVDLYSYGDLKISISSIVGKNGSGKSTVVEFLYLIINKIAFAKKIKSTEKLINEEVYADLFVKLDKLYKIELGEAIDIFEYRLDDDNKTYHISTSKINIEAFDIERFCYSLVVNYSLYAFNTNIIGNWVYPLFHKNDSYQTPIVLNPLRNEGNIDVNNEEGLAKSRMLSNILEPDLIDFDKKIIPELVPNSIPTSLVLELDEEKINRKRAAFNERYARLHRKQVNKVAEALGINQKNNQELIEVAKEYIFLKLVAIADKYPKFRTFKNLPEWISSSPEKLKAYILKLSEETSHITFKLKQAINYLRYNIYSLDERYSIMSLSERIRSVKEEMGIRTIELISPAFFKTNLIFDHGGTFNELSSGEKQQIFSINTIAYHIYNIASVMYEEDSYKYNNINIVFDEVELYFHPEMQRTYISNLLHRISTLQLEDNIHNINMLFITHSPFILSDIPSSNILRLIADPKTKKAIPAIHQDQTFGANIHDLLANDFFLENGFMGKFANDKIQTVIEQIESFGKSKNNNENLKLKDELYKIIQLIGEPLVKESLMDLYREKIGLNESEISITDIDAEIARLQELKNKMR